MQQYYSQNMPQHPDDIIKGGLTELSAEEILDTSNNRKVLDGPPGAKNTERVNTERVALGSSGGYMIMSNELVSTIVNYDGDVPVSGGEQQRPKGDVITDRLNLLSNATSPFMEINFAGFMMCFSMSVQELMKTSPPCLLFLEASRETIRRDLRCLFEVIHQCILQFYKEWYALDNLGNISEKKKKILEFEIMNAITQFDEFFRDEFYAASDMVRRIGHAVIVDGRYNSYVSYGNAVIDIFRRKKLQAMVRIRSAKDIIRRCMDKKWLRRRNLKPDQVEVVVKKQFEEGREATKELNVIKAAESKLCKTMRETIVWLSGRFNAIIDEEDDNEGFRPVVSQAPPCE